MKNMGLLLSSILLLFACKEQDLVGYTEQPRIYFNLLRTELYDTHPGSTAKNIFIDFAPKKSTVTNDELLLRVQVSGPASEEDRPFALTKVSASNNAEEGVDYQIENEKLFIPAGKFDTLVRVIVLRNDKMKSENRSFTFQLAENEYFALGPKADTTTYAYKRVTDIKVNAKDIVVKPGNWDSFLQQYFGTYSQVKHRFIVDVIGTITISSSSSSTVMNRHKNNLVNALNTYNASHPQPLTDENNNPVVF